MSKLFTLAFTLQCFSMSLLLAWNGNAQVKSIEDVPVHLSLNEVKVEKAFKELERITEYNFVFANREVRDTPLISVDSQGESMYDLLVSIASQSHLSFKQVDQNIHVKKSEKENLITLVKFEDITISGTVTDENGEPLPGVTIIIEGTNTGTVTDFNGTYSLQAETGNVLVFSFVGFESQKVTIGNSDTLNVELLEDQSSLDEVVVVGYGTQKKKDLTGSIVRANIEDIGEQPKVSLLQHLQGSVPGLNVGQVNSAGQNPEIEVRGVSSLSGEQAPLIIVDNIIFRGNIIDINPNDVESIDILKDASAAAIYGSQASNGVILITTKSGKISEKPMINYSVYHAIQGNTKEFFPESPDEFINRITAMDYEVSRFQESGYIETRPDYDVKSTFKENHMIDAFNKGITTNWYELLTNDRMYTSNHNLSLSDRYENGSYFVSLGYTDQKGYMINDEFNRINARINVDSYVTDWLHTGFQSFISLSRYPGLNINPGRRYFAHAYGQNILDNGDFNLYPNGQNLNPILEANSDYKNKRIHLFGNIFAEIQVPFIDGLSYRLNFGNNYRTTSEYSFRDYALNFQGMGFKEEGIRYEYIFDNIISYKKNINNIHQIDLTLLYGVEKRQFSSTRAESSVFINKQLSYNRLQSGNSDLQIAESGGWEEASLYNMVRLFYSLKDKYLITGTVRRDGFSGFSDQNKFGIFPSVSLGWNASEESFIKDKLSFFSFLKLRGSYGATGNRTVGRYQTMARVSSGFNYVDTGGGPIYTQGISSIASPDLKWETTLGFNFGLDFGIFSQRLTGAIDYYNNNTYDLLYNVDIPGINRFSTFPDNLGKLHNEGLEIALSSINLDKGSLYWTTDFVFSMNRNTLVELLGFDNDGDGIEDDLVSEGLFIGQPLSSIFAPGLA
ncbi:MAG: SusC/RagA family TonB-linked outer membrane protein [Cyclobacterium sp.]|uniref:SusC/RagA family TonB-linked outer membrane protein n=1 Tax=Cyclobacterium sp. TaxID=1966343 RepID=UPI0039709AC8